MLSTKAFVDRYMSRLDSGEKGKNNQPNCGYKITEAYINKKVKSFEKVLDSDVFDEIIEE